MLNCDFRIRIVFTWWIFLLLFHAKNGHISGYIIYFSSLQVLTCFSLTKFYSKQASIELMKIIDILSHYLEECYSNKYFLIFWMPLLSLSFPTIEGSLYIVFALLHFVTPMIDQRKKNNHLARSHPRAKREYKIQRWKPTHACRLHPRFLKQSLSNQHLPIFHSHTAAPYESPPHTHTPPPVMPRLPLALPLFRLYG